MIKHPQEEHPNDELYQHHYLQADKGQSAIRIDKFLVDKMEKISRNRIQNAIKAEAVLVNGKPIKSNYKIRGLDKIEVVLPKPPIAGKKPIAQNIPLDIVYEDEAILIINKQSGLVVHPGVSNYDGTLVNALVHHFKENDLPVMKGNLADRPGIVHRIDKNTTGLMVIAKTEFAMTHLAKQFFDHSIERRYQALIWGQPDEMEGTINAHIGRDNFQRKRMRVYAEGDEGKNAITHFKILEPLYYVSLIECRLETGRTHQIRVHFSWKGHPIFSDEKYGGDKVCKGTVFTKYKQFVENQFKIMPRHALHAKSLGFVHPLTEKKVFFESDLPNDMETVLNNWRNYLNSRKKLELV